MACHKNGDEEDVAQHSFKAVDNVFVPDPETPVVTSLSTSITGYDSRNRTYSGSFTIGFSKPVYWTSDGATAWNIHATSPTTPGGTIAADGEDYKELMRYVSGSAKGYLYFDAYNRPTTPQTSYTISFSNMPSGQSLTLFSSGDVANSSAGRDQNAQLEIIFRAYPNRAEEEVSGFTGTWKKQNVENTILSTIPTGGSSGGDIAIYFLSANNPNMETPSSQPTVRLNVGDTFPAKATVDTDVTQRMISWTADGATTDSTGQTVPDSVALVSDSATESATITALGIGETTVTIHVTLAGGATSYKSIRVIVTDDLTVSVVKSSPDTVNIVYDDVTDTISWERSPGTRPTEMLTLTTSSGGVPKFGSNTSVDWTGGGSVVSVRKVSNTSAQISVQGMGSDKITITVKSGNNIILTKEINITVTGSDTGLNISSNPIIR